MLAGYRGSFAAARILFTQTLTRVAYAPFRYYDTTPTGGSRHFLHVLWTSTDVFILQVEFSIDSQLISKLSIQV